MKFKHLLFVLTLLLIGCASPQKKFNQQDYEAAYKLALRELKKDKAVKQNKGILKNALAKIIDEELPLIKKLREDPDFSNWQQSLKHSEKLQEKIKDSEPFLGTTNETLLAELQQIDQQNKEDLYYHFLNVGQEKLEKSIASGYKKYAVDAYRDFKNAEKYGTSSGMDSLFELTYQYGTLVYEVEADAPFEITQNWEIDRQFEDVERQSSGFLEVYYEKNVSGVDCFLEVDFRSLDFRMAEDSENINFEKEVQDGYRTETDTSGNTVRIPVYKVVTGGVTITQRLRQGYWEARVNIRSLSRNCDLSDQTFSAARESVAEQYATYGDERAIPDKYKKRNWDDLESEDDMAEEMLEDIYRDFINYYF